MRPGPRFLTRAIFSALPLFTLSNSVRAQSKIPALPVFSSSASGDCRAFLPLRLADAGSIPVDGRSRCADGAFPRTNEPAATVARPLLSGAGSPDVDSDPVASELLAMGKRGREVLSARNEVLAVLEGSTGCSAWYTSKEPDAVAMFRSLHMILDEHDAGLIRKVVVPGQEWFYVQPYVARAQQAVGPGSTITINEHGAFFDDARGVVTMRDEGGPATYEPARLLHVGTYRGGTEEARVLTMLHEFGHIIDLLPLDAGVPSGPEISMHNTDLVVAHCKTELEAVSRKPKKNSPGILASLRGSGRP